MLGKIKYSIVSKEVFPPPFFFKRNTNPITCLLWGQKCQVLGRLREEWKIFSPDTTTSCDCFPRLCSILTRPGVCGVWNFYHCQFHAEYQAIAYESLVLHYALPCNTTLHCNILPCAALTCIALNCTAPHCTALHYTALHYTALQFTALHCNTLHHTHVCSGRHSQKKRSFPFKYSYHATNTKSRYTQFFSQSWKIIGVRRSADFNLFFNMTIAPSKQNWLHFIKLS